MNPEDLELKLVRDTQLANIKKSLAYAVKQGPASIDWQSYNAISKTGSSITFTIQPPSENSAINRVFLVETEYNFKLRFASAVNGAFLGKTPFNWGSSVSTQSFPFNRNIVTATLNINGASNSCSTQDVLPLLLRMFDEEDLQKFSGMTPCMLDKCQKYTDVAATSNDPIRGLNYSGYNKFLEPRGVHPISNLAFTHEGGGSDGVGVLGTTSITAAFTIKIIEPLFISPLLFKPYPNNDQAIIGVNSINVNLNTDATFARFFSYSAVTGNAGGPLANPTIELVSISDCKLHLNYMSLQPGHSLETRNIVPFMDYTRQTQSVQLAIKPDNLVTSNSYQLSIIPDKILIAVSPAVKDIGVADHFYPITNINITFGTQSGLLSNANQFQLYRMSCDAGLKAQSWYEWSGKINKENESVNTVGSVLVIDPTMLNLPEYLAPGSQGQFTISFKLTVSSHEAITAIMTTIFCNSGAYVTQSGRSSFYLGLLDKASVVALNEAQGQDPMSRAQLDRMVGGAGLSDSVAAGLSSMSKMGSARSGGSRSGGRRSKLDDFLA